MAYVFSLLTAGVLVGAVAIPILLQLIGAKIEFIPVEAWLLFGGLSLILQFDFLCCAVSATGNQLIFYYEMGIATAVSAGLLLLFGNSWSIYTPIITSTIPLLLILNFRPVLKARSILNSGLNV
jgi:hypothetical protein